MQLLTRALQLLTARTQARREIIEPSSEALQAYRETLGDRHPDTLASINNMGNLLSIMGEALMREWRSAQS